MLYEVITVEAFKKRTARRKEGIKEEYEARLLNADKRFVWVSVSATPQYNEKGEYVGTLSILKDITSAKLQNIAAKISFEVAEKISKPNTTLENVITSYSIHYTKLYDLSAVRVRSFCEWHLPIA